MTHFSIKLIYLLGLLLTSQLLAHSSLADESESRRHQQDQQQTVENSRASAPIPIEERLDELGKMVESYVNQHRVVGAELQVILDDQTIYHQSFGMSDKNDEKPWVNDTICNIRSMTKPITSTAAQILVDRGKLSLDVPVADYLDSFDNDKSREITVRHVLTHRSGLPLTNLVGPYQYKSLADQVDAAGNEGPEFKPGSKFWYSDTGTDVVGRLVEKVSGQPLHEFVHHEIFEPLKMTHTFYGIDAKDERFSKIASLHLKGPEDWVRFWVPKRPLYPFAWGSQTVYSTTSDYAKFLKMFLNNGRAGDRQLISEQAIQRMLEPVSEMKMLGSDAKYPTGFRNLESFYGQMMVTHRVDKESSPMVIGHSGSDGTNSWAWPEKNLIVLYFTQSRGGMTALKIEKPIDRLLIHPGIPIPSEEAPEHLKPYIGKYIANFASFKDEEFTVFVKNGKLVLDVPSQMEFELKDPDENGKWAFAIAPEKIQLAFDKDDNRVIGLRMFQSGREFTVPRKD